jgi:O-methyltransferase
MGFLKRLAYCLAVPVLFADYLDPQTGAEYGIGWLTKIRLALHMGRNSRRIVTGSRVAEHLIMATKILKVPKSVHGSVVECGSFKGGSAANLSLVCALCDRQLEIFDSFQGLPEPEEGDRSHALVNSQQLHTYEKEAWKGTLDEVTENIRRNGKIEHCSFHVGYFADTLPSFRRPCVLAFLDVDLRASLEPCVQYLWPLLHEGCYLFTHEAPHMEIASLFFSENWWAENLRSAPPGLVGAGNGLGLWLEPGGASSGLGYALKSPQVERFFVNPQIGTAAAKH